MSDPVQSTMQDAPRLISAILKHGASVYADSRAFTFDGGGVQEGTYGEVAERAARLANGLASLGVEPGDRVGTFLWNNQEHLEAYLAVPSMGAVLHTLNLRLFPEQLAYVIDDARGALRARRRGRHQRARGRAGSTRSCLRACRPTSSGPSSTSGRPPRCATRAAPRATPRASSTATGRPTCTRSPRRPETPSG